MTIEAVIFDLGGVLAHLDGAAVVQELARIAGQSAHALERREADNDALIAQLRVTETRNLHLAGKGTVSFAPAAMDTERAEAEFVKHKENADPAAVAFDAVAAASARGCDLVLIDTAGRLHTKVNLMEELKKIKRTVAKQLPGAPHEILLVLDATTGQNAISQATLFNEALDITGLALTKLDGTAKGGIAVSICSTLNIPLKYIGVGEQIDDLQDFDPQTFVEALF